MEIANPIYDVVFKFMLEDLETARIFLSGLLEVEVLEVSFAPQELTHSSEQPIPQTSKKEKKNNRNEPEFSVRPVRLDFVAKVKTKEHGEHLVIIELQKVRLLSDIMRFRRYLGAQYSNSSNTYQTTNKKGNVIRNALPIFSVYFLGDRLDNIAGVPIIGVYRKYLNLSNQEEIEQKDPFIESLTHDCRIVIIPDLPGHQSTELEKMLMIFDQTTAKNNGQILDLNTSAYPGKYEQLFRRLEKAAQSVEVRKVMDEEDDWLVEYQYWDLNTERVNKERDEAVQGREEERRKKEEAVRLAEEERWQKEEAIRQKEEAVRQKDEGQKKIEKAIRGMLSMGMSHEQIASTLSVSVEEIKNMVL